MSDLRARKQREAILFFMHECNDEGLGTTKLYKLLYYLDFDHYERYGTSVTGDRYRKQQFGPVGESAEVRLQQMLWDGEYRSHQIPWGQGKGVQRVYTPLRKADLSIFDESELRLLFELRDRFQHDTARLMSDGSHLEEPWLMAGPLGSEIPYYLAHLRRSGGPSAGSEAPLSGRERDLMIQDLIATQALEDIRLSLEEASAIVDAAFADPAPQLG
jgi:hypothetical protein